MKTENRAGIMKIRTGAALAAIGADGVYNLVVDGEVHTRRNSAIAGGAIGALAGGAAALGKRGC